MWVTWGHHQWTVLQCLQSCCLYIPTHTNTHNPFTTHFKLQVCALPPPPHVVNKPQHYTLVSWAIDHGFWRVPSLAACMAELDQVTDIVVTQSNRKSGETGMDTTSHTQSHTHNIKLFKYNKLMRVTFHPQELLPMLEQLNWLGCAPPLVWLGRVIWLEQFMWKVSQPHISTITPTVCVYWFSCCVNLSKVIIKQKNPVV